MLVFPKLLLPNRSLASSVERESLDIRTCACASDSSSIAVSKLASLLMLPKVIHMARVLLTCLELIFLNQSSIAPFARKMDILLSFAFTVSSTSDVCVLKILESLHALLLQVNNIGNLLLILFLQVTSLPIIS